MTTKIDYRRSLLLLAIGFFAVAGAWEVYQALVSGQSWTWKNVLLFAIHLSSAIVGVFVLIRRGDVDVRKFAFGLLMLNLVRIVLVRFVA